MTIVAMYQDGTVEHLEHGKPDAETYRRWLRHYCLVTSGELDDAGIVRLELRYEGQTDPVADTHIGL